MLVSFNIHLGLYIEFLHCDLLSPPLSIIADKYPYQNEQEENAASSQQNLSNNIHFKDYLKTEPIHYRTYIVQNI